MARTAKQSALNTIVDNMVNQSAARAVVNDSAATLKTNRAALALLIEDLPDMTYFCKYDHKIKIKYVGDTI